MLRRKIGALFNPERYHGWGKENRYFEGWYYKVISPDEKHAFAFIPGIAMDENGEKQSFIQVLDGKKLTAEYHKFSADVFRPEAETFSLSLDKSFFTERSIKVELPSIQADLRFSNQVPWPKPWYSPGIMGPFSFIPFMQCYHGIVSMDHDISGEITVDGYTIDMNGGKGYMEKDWGRSFPSAYIWMQSNHFSEPGISFKSSVAKIPWLGSSFIGFIAGLWLKDKLYRFTTYNFTRLKKSYADQDIVEVHMENPSYRLEILAHREEATELASPISGFMDGRIEESMNARLEVTLTEKKSGTIIFQDTGRNAGLEVAGNIDEIRI